MEPGGSKDANIFTAAAEGNLDLIKELLQGGVSVNSIDITPDSFYRSVPNKTPLMYAAENGHIGCVNFLIEYGADVKLKVTGFDSALNWAARKGSLCCLPPLIDRGADVNDSLLLAAESGHIECVRYLVERGASVNYRQMYSGSAALSEASGSGHFECVKFLIEKGADVNYNHEGTGSSALIRASADGHAECVKILLENGADVNYSAESEYTALTCASFKGHIECLRILSANGADVNQKNARGVTALFCAKNDKTVNILLAAGAVVNKKDPSNKTALIDALSGGRIGAAKALIEAGADVNDKANDGYTALLYSIHTNGYGKDIFLLKELFRAGYKINVSYYDIKAVYRGTRARRDKVIALLLAASEEKSKIGKIPKYLQPPKKINMKHFCREKLRNHLLRIDPHENLFVRVPKPSESTTTLPSLQPNAEQ